jgi:hypothetical protein
VRKACSTSERRCGQHAVEGVVGDEVPVAQQEQPVAAGRLVHDVAAHDEGPAAVGEPAEQAPQVTAQHGVEADGRLVEDEQLRLGEQGRREGDPRLLAAGQAVHSGVRGGGQVDLGQDPVDAGGGRRDHLREVLQVAPDGQVGVHRWALRDVADALPQSGVAGWAAEDAQGPARACLHADDRAQQRRLAAAARSEQSGDLASRHGERQPVQHLLPSSLDVQVPRLDR